MTSQSILVTIMLLLVTEINSEILSKTDCTTCCGDLNIPFPFGTTSDCYLDDSFLISCNHSYNPSKTFLNSGSIEVLEIPLDRLMNVSSLIGMVILADKSLSRKKRKKKKEKRKKKILVHKSMSPFQSAPCPCSWIATLEKFIAVGYDTFLPSYTKRLKGNLKKDRSGCHPKSRNTLLYVVFGVPNFRSGLILVPAVGSSWIFWRRKQKRVATLRQNLFRRNGDLILENMLSRQETLQVFTAEDLKRATDNYNENRVLYRDEYGEITYKGILPDAENQQVTIKKCYELEGCNSFDIFIFISKLVTLSRINHKNIVKFIGCCLETQVPLLVCESINTRTPYDYIHDDYGKSSLSWDIHLKIAAETAGALACLHSVTPQVPIIHGNLNSYGITLNQDYTVKLHDFGLTNQVPGFELRRVFGYLDPEYFTSGRLTEKSDVYSFGVVLAELLTGKKVILVENITDDFVSLPRGDDLIRILDRRLVAEGKIEQLIEVAKLAQRCLLNSSADRQTMKDIVIDLKDVISWNSSTKIFSPNSSQEASSRRVVLR